MSKVNTKWNPKFSVWLFFKTIDWEVNFIPLVSHFSYQWRYLNACSDSNSLPLCCWLRVKSHVFCLLPLKVALQVVVQNAIPLLQMIAASKITLWFIYDIISESKKGQLWLVLSHEWKIWRRTNSDKKINQYLGMNLCLGYDSAWRQHECQMEQRW